MNTHIIVRTTRNCKYHAVFAQNIEEKPLMEGVV